jgi:hypothetical protein
MKEMMRKRIKRYLLFIAPLILLSACAYDNYSPPQSKLHGKVVYNGKPIHVQSQQVTFRMYQKGFKLHTPITVQVNPDGSYHALVFNGNYQIIFAPGVGPFIQDTKTDTLDVTVKGNTEQDINVKPYFMLNNPQFSASGRTISATFSLKQIIPSSNIQFVGLYLGKTRFANPQRNVVFQTIDGSQIQSLNGIHLSATVPKLTPTQNYVFAHIGVKIQGVGDMLFSKVDTLQLK